MGRIPKTNELDEQVCQALEIPPTQAYGTYDGGERWAWKSPSPAAIERIVAEDPDSGLECVVRYPKVTTDPRSARRVVTAMEARGYTLTYSSADDGQVISRFVREAEQRRGLIPGWIAPTWPQSVCKAALAALEREKAQEEAVAV